jgi:serine/threonine protein kinase
MPDASLPPSDVEKPPEPLNLARQLDLLSDEYERQWRVGPRPDPATFVARVPGAASAAFRHDLAAIELELRWQAGEEVRPWELAVRFGVPVEPLQEWLNFLRDESVAETPPQGPPRLTPNPDAPPRPASLGITPSRPAPSDEITLPCRFGEYELLEKLGQGGMGAVYRARHVRLGKAAAIKVIRPDRAGSEALARFERELRAIGSVEHPHLVGAHYAGEHQGRLFLVMELLDGIDLVGLVRRTGPLPSSAACELVRQAALGLQQVHDAGLVHRDVKPSNLMLTATGVVKVLDLGLVRLVSLHPAESDLTGSDCPLGTADYVAPEQQQNAARVSAAADVYSLGATLFFLLTGRAPFGHHQDYLDKLVAHRREEIPDLRGLRPEIPPAVVRLVQEMLAKEGARRPARMKFVAEALAPLCEGADVRGLLHTEAAKAPIVVAPPSRPRSVGAQRRLSRAMRWARWALLATAPVLGALALIWYPGAAQMHRDKEPLAPGSVESTGDSPQAAALTVRELSVEHFVPVGNKEEPRGKIGKHSFRTRFGDKVRVNVELSGPAYCHLLALNPDGTVDWCWPEDKQAPPRRDRLEYPEDALESFPLNDEPRGGQQVFVVVAATDPLPAAAAWKQELPALAWARQASKADLGTTAWIDLGNGLHPLYPPDDQRGPKERLRGNEALQESVRQLRAIPRVAAVAALAFPVLPKDEP